MATSTPARLVDGLLTIIPIGYFAFFAMGMSSLTSAMAASPNAFDRFIRINMIATIGMVLLIGGHIVYLFRTARVPQSKKALWAVVLLVAGAFSMPVFWWIYIRPATWSMAPRNL
jgi:hypothetical protein